MTNTEDLFSQLSGSIFLKHLRLFFYLSTPYAFFCAIIYQISYWSTFQLDFFQYLSFTDIIRLSIYPLVTIIIIWLILNILFIITAAPLLERQSKKKEGSKSSLKYVLIGGIIFFILYLILSLVIGRIFYALFYSFSWIFVAKLTDKIFDFIEKKYNNVWHYRVHLSLPLFLIIFLPFVSFITAKDHANKILENFNVRHAETSQFQVLPEFFENQKKLNMLVMAGTSMFS